MLSWVIVGMLRTSLSLTPLCRLARDTSSRLPVCPRPPRGPGPGFLQLVSLAMGVVVCASALFPAAGGSCLLRISGAGSSPNSIRNWTTIACDLACLCLCKAFGEGYAASQQPQVNTPSSTTLMKQFCFTCPSWPQFMQQAVVLRVTFAPARSEMAMEPFSSPIRGSGTPVVGETNTWYI